MSTKLGTLTLDLVAKIGSFVGPIKDAEKQTESSFSNMRKHVNNYGAIAIAGAAAVGAGVFAMANEYANAAREIQTFASISNANTQEFQKMAAGAEIVGIPMDKLSDQLKDFNEKLGEFVTIGSGGAVDFFEQIAVKTEGSAEGARKLALEMQNLSGPQALQLYVDKLEEAGVTQQQMSFYLESMASDTTNLIPLLKDGGKGFEFWADAAERAGLMSEETIAKAGELTVQMKLLDLQVKGAKNQFIQGLMPALVSIGDSFSDATTETNLMADAGETLGHVFKGVAATGMGVYAVVKMLTNSVAGLSVEIVKAKQITDSAAEGGSWADKLPGVKLFKTGITAGVMARAPDSAVAMAAADNAKVVEDVGSAINKMYSNTVNEAVSAMAKIQSSQVGVAEGSEDWVKKQNKATESAKANTKAQLDNNRALEDRNRIIYEYSTADRQAELDLEAEKLRLTKNGLSDFIPTANARFDAEQRLIKMKFEFELAEHLMTEEQKLRFSNTIREQEIKSDAQFSKDQRSEKLKSLNETFNQELAAYKRTQQTQLLEAKRHWVSAEDYARDYYALIREEILATSAYSPEMKQALVKEANFNQGLDQNAKREQVWGDYKDRFGAEELPYQQDIDLLAEARAQMLITEEEYQKQRLALQMTYGAQYGADFAGALMGMVDTSSSAYQALFFAQKSFYLAQAGMNVWKSASDAYANEPGTVWQKMGAAALATIESGTFVSLIEAASPVGMAHDGIDNIPKEGTWLLDKGERVVDSRTNADLKGMIANQKNGGGDVHISVHVTDSGVTTQSNQADQKQLGQMIGNAVRTVIQQEQRQGGLLSR